MPLGAEGLRALEQEAARLTEVAEQHACGAEAELADELRAMHETVTGLKGDVRSVTDRIPIPTVDRSRGREVFTSSSE